MTCLCLSHASALVFPSMAETSHFSFFFLGLPVRAQSRDVTLGVLRQRPPLLYTAILLSACFGQWMLVQRPNCYKRWLVQNISAQYTNLLQVCSLCENMLFASSLAICCKDAAQQEVAINQPAAFQDHQYTHTDGFISEAEAVKGESLHPGEPASSSTAAKAALPASQLCPHLPRTLRAENQQFQCPA